VAAPFAFASAASGRNLQDYQTSRQLAKRNSSGEELPANNSFNSFKPFNRYAPAAVQMFNAGRQPLDLYTTGRSSEKASITNLPGPGKVLQNVNR